MEFEKQLKQKVEEIEAILEEYLPEETGFQKTLFEAMNYSVRAGGAGLKLGAALIAPGALSRAAALQTAARVSIKLVGGVIVFLVLAAFIEAYWSSSNSTAVPIKLAVGASLWLLVLTYLAFSGRRRYAA